MDHDKKLAFIAKMTKMGLDHVQHLDDGGTVLGGPAATTVGANTGQAPQPLTSYIAPVSALNGIQNQYSAQGAPIQQGTNAAQLNNAYTGVQGGLQTQQGLVGQTAPGIAQGLGAQGVLSNQLANEAAGAGPNPAQAALAESTRNNVNTTAAQLAGARGSSGNVGLMARNIGQQGAQTQQNAIGQAATLQAQQQIAAQQQQQSLAAQQIGQGTGAATTLNQEQQNEQNILQGANTAGNNAAVSMQGNINNVNAGISTQNQQAAQTSLGGLLSGGSALTNIFAKGGMVKMDEGGNVLDANARKHIAPHNFALPGGRYPIHDISHARNALARVSQNGTPAEKAKVKAAVHKKYPSLAGKKMAEGGDVEFQATGTPSDESSSSPQIQSYQAPQTAKKSGGGGAGILAALLAEGGEVRDGYMAAKYKGYACGGDVPGYAGGGYIAPQPLVVNSSGPQSFAGQWVNSSVNPGSAPTIAAAPSLPTQPQQSDTGAKVAGNLIKRFKSSPNTPPQAAVTGAMAGMNAAPSEDIQSPVDESQPVEMDNSERPDMYCGGLAAKGGDVVAKSDSEKAKVKGDSLKNDKIPALLSAGEVVMDRETLADPGPVGQMARAVAMHIKKRNGGK